MKPQLGDTIIHRYVLVSPLREAPGIQVWKANDQVLDRYCQLFIVTDASAVEEVNGAASLLVTAPEHRCTPILHIHHPEDGAVIVVTEFDPGVCLTDYLDDPDHGTVGYDAIRSIVGDTAYTAQHLLENGVEHHALGTDTIRVSADGIQFADTPVSVMYQDMDADIADRSVEERLVYQVASVLYRLLTHTPYTGAADALDALPEEERLARLVTELVCNVKVGCSIVVIKTLPGGAQGVCAALDAAHFPGALGTVAGDDTIMIAAESFEAADQVARMIERLRRR